MCYFLLYSKVKTELPYDPEILLLGIYPEKSVIPKDTRTPVFTAAGFTTAKTWKQPKSPLNGYRGCGTSIQQNITQKKKGGDKIVPYAEMWVALEMDIQSEVSHRKTNTIYLHSNPCPPSTANPPT